MSTPKCPSSWLCQRNQDVILYVRLLPMVFAYVCVPRRFKSNELTARLLPR